MQPNVKRGLKRLAVAILIPWFAYWLFVGWRGYAISTDAAQAIDAVPAGGDIPMVVLQALEAGNRHLFDAIVYGAVGPVTILVVAGIAYWIARGFVANHHI